MTKYIFFYRRRGVFVGQRFDGRFLGGFAEGRGLKVGVLRLDTYFNTDTGQMNPYQHGEVFVTDDGAETDLDLGHYERFIDESLNKYSNGNLRPRFRQRA